MTKFIKGFYFAAKGISYAFRTQVNFRVEVVIAFLVIPLSWYLNLSSTEWLWICSAIVMVLITELANTAIETLVDLVSPEFNPRAGIIKDLFAAVVLLSALFAVVVGALIILPKLIHVT